MERTLERGLSSGQGWGMGNGAPYNHAAQDLALVDAGIALGVFGYQTIVAREDALDEARVEDALAEHALAHEQALLSQGRKSKLALLRGETDGSVRGLRNAVISIGHWFDLHHAPEGNAVAPAEAGYAESWRIGWADRLPEIMKLSVDGPLEDMGLEASGHVPQSDPVPHPFGLQGAAGTEGEGPSDAGRAFLEEMLAEDDEPQGFVFASDGAEDSLSHHSQAVLAQEEVMFLESQYAALHGALFDGDASWQGPGDFDHTEEGATHHGALHRPDPHGHGDHGQLLHAALFDGHFA
ncbi:hypothetical protein CLG85_004685 [Yangia mangrovi]|uniref:Uncharacterized protein n=2 Tax=Alloyangia mangrovi TaxID=1779329 RepID=A0ABT2KIX2_9RHOB|nr:hypothetical protein [Alloyangia mangrovi]MCT4369673.1 hypothetical protein [Alloyangia mangrovi]